MSYEAFSQLIGVVKGISTDAKIMPLNDSKLMDYDVNQFKRMEPSKSDQSNTVKLTYPHLQTGP